MSELITNTQGPVPNNSSGPETMEPPAPTFVPAPATAPAQSVTSFPDQCLYKNRLQEYTQRSAIPLPIYHTINEGFQHAPKFRSFVFVDGMYYKSPNTFSHRKAAEQDVARVALLGISQKIKDEGSLLIRGDTVFCKSILIEYAVKMNLEKPIYITVQSKGLLPAFVSSLVFNGVRYTGDTGRNKKEAEQLAARAVILSILESGSGNAISEIIKSKFKLYAALNKAKDLSSYSAVVPIGISTGIDDGKRKAVEVAGNTNIPMSAIPEPYLGQSTSATTTNQHFHEFKKPRAEPSSEPTTLPIVFVPQAFGEPSVVDSGVINKAVEVAGNNNLPVSAISGPCVCQSASVTITKQPFHEFKKPRVEQSSDSITLPSVVVPQVLGLPPVVDSSSRKRNKNKKAKKKLQVDAQLSVNVLPLSQIPPCSVAQ